MKISGTLFALASLYLFSTALCSLTESEESSKALKSNKNQNDDGSATNVGEVSEPPKSEVTGTKKRKKGRGMGKQRKKEENDNNNDNGLTTTEEPDDEDDLTTTTMVW